MTSRPAPLTPAAPLPRRSPRATGPVRAAWVLWGFGRPHTIIGTTLSVVALWVIAAAELPGPSAGRGLFELGATLLAALCVNVFIVGINQITDVEIDIVNKPFLPIAAGELSVRGAWWIVGVAGVVPVGLALTQGWLETLAVLAALLVGVAYSVPPLRLKRFPSFASLSISLVRGVVVNLGVWVHLSGAFGGGTHVPATVWALTAFVLPFSFAIAILKDVPDMEGDRRYAVATFSVRFGPERVVALALGVLSVAYLLMASVGAVVLTAASAPVLVVAHLLGLGLLWRWRSGVDLHDREAFTAFYMGVWKLFFLEYVLVATACAVGAL